MNTIAVSQPTSQYQEMTKLLKKIEPLTLLFLSLIAMVGLHFFLPIYRVIPVPFNYIGLPLILAGIILNIWADRLFKKANTTVKPSENPTSLIVEGPFRFSRHPMYLGMAAVLTGVAMLLGTVLPWAVLTAFVEIVDRVYIRQEEKIMKEQFGDSYETYSEDVGRWI
ncbi:MAG: methyltransferase family protein [Candidatus Brocadiia bacterium]